MNYSAETDFDYLLAALAAKLMFVSAPQTPVYFPETTEEAENLINNIVADYVPGSRITHFVIIPASSEERASLGVIYSIEKNTIAARFMGKGIYDLLTRGENL